MRLTTWTKLSKSRTRLIEHYPVVTDEEVDYSTEDFDNVIDTGALADGTIDSFASL